MSARSRRQSTETKLTAFRDSWSTGRCTAEAIQRMGDHCLDLRRGPGALWPGPGPQHHDKMPRSRHQSHIASFAHTLQIRQVSFIPTELAV